MNIYQRLNEVRKAVPYLKKDKDVQGRYSAITHDAVTAGLREHLIAQGVLIVPNLVKSAANLSGMTTSKGVPFIRYEATYCIDFVNIDEPADKVSVNIESHALDEGDKAPGKAVSYATKYAMLKLFNIETGDDEESRIDAKIKSDKGKSMPTSGTVEQLVPARREFIDRVLSTIIDCVNAEQVPEAWKSYKEITDTDEKVALWSMLPREIKKALKTEGEKQGAK